MHFCSTELEYKDSTNSFSLSLFFNASFNLSFQPLLYFFLALSNKILLASNLFILCLKPTLIRYCPHQDSKTTFEVTNDLNVSKFNKWFSTLTLLDLSMSFEVVSHSPPWVAFPTWVLGLHTHLIFFLPLWLLFLSLFC